MELIIILLIYTIVLTIGILLRSLIYKWTFKEMVGTFIVFVLIGYILIFFVYSCENWWYRMMKSHLLCYRNDIYESAHNYKNGCYFVKLH